MKLVIVESPTKAKTISKFLGAGYKVESSFGHVRDLPKSNLGVDTEHDFEPKYVVPTKAKKTVTKLKELAAKADSVILASDEDREGEAIAWHLAQILKLKPADTQRIVFHEITKPAILAALKNPRGLDQPLVDAQQARRVLDRLVGYELSPFLWKKVAKGLSAGRVQSVAVRLVVEREREILAFKSEEYWSIDASLQTPANEKLVAQLNKIDDQTLDKFAITDQAKAEEITTDLKQQNFTIKNVEKKTASKKAPTPFTTSGLQQAANRQLGFSAKQTMMLAQQLYEGIELGSEGNVGLITYMRTDSLNLAQKFLDDARDYLQTNLGKDYALDKPRVFKTKSKNAQEAHEAIRPTEANLAPEQLKNHLNNNQFRLYQLIWQRSLASQMPDAQFDNTGIDIAAGIYNLRATGQVLIFPGWLKIYPEKSDEQILPKVTVNEKLNLNELTPNQHFTKPPARYSDAGLIKKLEAYGIGRPSTYAPTMATIEERNYVERDEQKKLKPTAIAFVVIDLLVKHFPQIVDTDFTAKMEKQFDDIAEGKIKWQPMIKEFYQPFHGQLLLKYNEVNKNDIMPEEKSAEICDKCGAPMIIKTGRFGKFLACSGFPDCKNIKSLNQDKDQDGQPDTQEAEALQKKYADQVCEKCGAPMKIKVGKFGPFLACTGYPKCKNIKNIKENTTGSTGITCPACNQGEITAKRGKRGVFYACNRYPDCKTAFWGKPTGEKCPDCQSLLIEVKDGVKCSAKGCGYSK